MAAAAAIMAIGAAVGAMGNLYSGYVNSQNQQAQAAALDFNAKLQDRQAQIARNNATAQSNAMLDKANQAIGTQRAFIAESGGGFGGTAFQALQQSAMNAASDNINILNQGEAQAQGFEMDAALNRANAETARRNATSSLIAGYFGASSSGFQGASGYTRENRYDNYMQSQAGASGGFNPISTGGWS